MSVAWSWPKRRRVADDAQPPRGVRLVLDDGTGRVVPCGVLREPQYDRRGVPAWLVVPLEDVGPLARTRGGFTVEADELPGTTLLVLDFGAGRRGPDDNIGT